MRSILLNGVLSRQSLQFALQEIEVANTEYYDLCLVVNAEGEDILPALAFIDSLFFAGKKYTIGRWNVKVYHASGVAAMIVALLRLREANISMRSGTSLGFSSGRVNVGPTDVTLTGELNDGLFQTFRRYNGLLVDTITSLGFSEDRPALLSTDPCTFLVSAQECLDRGIVQKLF